MRQSQVCLLTHPELLVANLGRLGWVLKRLDPTVVRQLQSRQRGRLAQAATAVAPPPPAPQDAVAVTSPFEHVDAIDRFGKHRRESAHSFTHDAHLPF